MRDLTTGAYVPTELDCDFQLTLGDPWGDGETLIEEGTPIGVHEIEYEGSRYRVVCSVAYIGPVEETLPKTNDELMQDDIAEVLRILRLGDHARPVSAHRVMQDEIIPELRRWAACQACPDPSAHR